MSKRIIGVDEAGRGALTGNVVAAAVILPNNFDESMLVDSKSISEKKRNESAKYIKQIAIEYKVGQATPKEIDDLNIHFATLLAMKRAVTNLNYKLNPADEVWVDGKFAPELDCITKTFVKGDSLHSCISAASILAKTYRDEQLILLDKEHPNYGFAKHKGYPTKKHIEAMIKFGILNNIYRRSYKPVKNIKNNLK